MSRVPFKLKSSGPFKMMGSSPAKQEFKAERRELTKQVGNGETEQQKQERKKGEKIESDMNKERYSEQKTGDPRPTGPIMPKDHPVTPPTVEQSKKSKGTLKGRTGFQADVVDPVKGKIRQGVNLLKTNVITKGKQKVNEAILKGGKKAYDYFTKK